jgi:hypothetical protein
VSHYDRPVPDQTTSLLLRVAGGICLVEAVALAVMGVVEIVSLDSDRLALGLTTTVFLFLYAAALGFAAFSVARARSWTRAPIVLSQLIQLGLAWSFHGSGTSWVAVLLAVPAVVVLVIMVRPGTTAALYGEQSAG